MGRFNRVNEERKESYDKQDAKLKQREEDMQESLRKAEAKYFPDLDLRSSFTDQSKDLDQSNDLDQSKYSDLDSDSSDDFVYVQKPKTNKIKCEECDEEIYRKNYNRHIQSLKHKKNERLYNRNKIIESANEDGIKITNENIEQKLDEQYLELDGIKFCDSCEMHLDNNTAYIKHATTLKHRNNVRLVNEEIVKNGSKFDCVICKTTLSQYSVDQHLKTKMHLDNVNPRSGFTDGKYKDIDKDNGEICSETHNITEGYYNICNTRYNNKKEHSDQMNIKKMLNRKILLIRSGEIKLVS